MASRTNLGPRRVRAAAARREHREEPDREIHEPHALLVAELPRELREEHGAVHRDVGGHREGDQEHDPGEEEELPVLQLRAVQAGEEQPEQADEPSPSR